MRHVIFQMLYIPKPGEYITAIIEFIIVVYIFNGCAQKDTKTVSATQNSTKIRNEVWSFYRRDKVAKPMETYHQYL